MRSKGLYKERAGEGRAGAVQWGGVVGMVRKEV